MTSKIAFEISSDQKVHLVSAANKIGKFCWPAYQADVKYEIKEALFFEKLLLCTVVIGAF